MIHIHLMLLQISIFNLIIVQHTILALGNSPNVIKNHFVLKNVINFFMKILGPLCRSKECASSPKRLSASYAFYIITSSGCSRSCPRTALPCQTNELYNKKQNFEKRLHKEFRHFVIFEVNIVKKAHLIYLKH